MSLPREFYETSNFELAKESEINILFCNLSIDTNEPFSANHSVPLIHRRSSKRGNSSSKVRTSDNKAKKVKLDGSSATTKHIFDYFPKIHFHWSLLLPL